VYLAHKSERLARDRTLFAAAAAHELRTPLAGLKIHADMLAEGLGDPGKRKVYAERVAGEAERLGRVVTNILGFTRLERSTLKVDRRPGDLAEWVREIVEAQRPPLQAAGVRLETDIPSGDWRTYFDRDAVAQIMQNLLDNAEKYSRDSPDRFVRITMSRGIRGEFRITVADNGPGIAKKERKSLFRPFARATNAGGSPAGLGLGLALVRALAREHEGDVVYEGGPPGGAIFTVTISES
jgi:two-component system sensor histidine kinase SenX3